MAKYKIACLTYKKLDVLTRNAISKINDPELDIVLLEGFMEDLIEKVNNARDYGVEVFIGGGANAETVKNISKVNVVPIKLTALDYIEALMKAKKVGNRIAIVTFGSTFKLDIKVLEEIIQHEIILIQFSKSGELADKLKAANIDVVIGASYSNEIAYSLGIASILIYPGEEAIISSIYEAKSIAVALRKEKENYEFTHAILQFNPSGIIATDEKGKIITFNRAVEKITGIQAKDAIGEDLKTVLPECGLLDTLENGQPQMGVVNKVRNNDVVIDRVPIEINNNIVGALAILSPTWVIQKTEQKIRLSNENKGFVANNNFCDIIGNSSVIKENIKDAKIFSKSDSSLLIYGETGVGKEIFAQSIHNYSRRSNGAFVAVNCAALPENLLESELFGYDEGAFTGSKKGGKTGLFEIAHEGTLLLDEIAEMTPVLQTKLLRVLQEKRVMRIGGDRMIPVDVRIIAATNKNLESKIPVEFRNDLFYRLSVLQLNIPPLRNRGDDVIDLFLHFLKYENENGNKFEMSSDLQKIIKLYSWPGNIRELQNVVERLKLFMDEDNELDKRSTKDLLIRAIGHDRMVSDLLKSHSTDLESKNFSKCLIEDLEFLFPGQKEILADKLGISRTTLWRLTKQ